MANCDNPRTGAEFEQHVRAFFANQGLNLQPNLPVFVGVGKSRKARNFDLGSEEPAVLVECKCHTWTAGGNSPSAKLTSWNEAMHYFSVAPVHYRKALVVQRSLRGTVSLAEHYLSRFEHLIPAAVEMWELDSNTNAGTCLRPSAVPHLRGTGHLLRGLQIPSEIVTEFFLTFARFEYALKAAGFVAGNETKASPDWDGFGRELAKLDAGTIAMLLGRCGYLRQHPPRKQVLKDGALSWVQPNRLQSDIENVLLDLRSVRNNVFHGGKFTSGPVSEPLRDRQLLEDCLRLLNGLLEIRHLPGNVGEHFLRTS